MARRNHLDDFTRGRMIGKLEKRRTVTSVAAEIGINKSVAKTGSSSVIAQQLSTATGRQVSRFTLARRLHKGDLFTRRPERCLPLNPIEHVWDALRRRIAARLHHPENTQQLKQMMIEEWALLPQEMLHQLDMSMRRRCEATIANVGGRTGKILRPSSVALKSKNQEINRLQLAVKLPWAIFFESVDILS
ncbi:transposable element Tcb2 transposase [Trichonephila clavipes]|nr:transposable element Tcb2 transposase [Trichonephila clavipes]